MTNPVTNEDILDAIRNTYAKLIDIEKRLAQLETSGGSNKPQKTKLGEVSMFNDKLALEIAGVFKPQFDLEATIERQQLLLTAIDLYLDAPVQPQRVKQEYVKDGKDRYRYLYLYPPTLAIFEAVQKAVKHLEDADGKEYFMKGLTQEMKGQLS